MRIGIDARLVYYSQAGIGQYILHLINGLAQIDHENEYVILQSRKDDTTILQQPNFRRVSLWTPSHHRLERLSLNVELMRLGLDVLHSPDFIPPHRPSCKSVITVHDLAFLLYPHFLTKESARYYGHIDQAVLLDRPYHRRVALYQAGHDRAPGGAGRQDHGRVRSDQSDLPSDRPRSGPPAGPRPVWRGRSFYPVCQHHRAPEERADLAAGLPAAPRVLPAGRAAWCWPAARAGSSRTVTTMIGEMHLDSQIHMIGQVPSEDLLNLYNAAEMLAHPAFYEGFGLPPLEAMSCGLPVIVSNVASLPEVVGDAALLIDPNDGRRIDRGHVARAHRPSAQPGDARQGAAPGGAFFLDPCRPGDAGHLPPSRDELDLNR